MWANLTRAARSLRCFLGLQFNNDPGYEKTFHTSAMNSSAAPAKDLNFEAITKNLELTTKVGKRRDGQQPLVVLFSWMLAKKKHIKKYSDFYMSRGFDVLTVRATPLQLLFPTRGSQVAAENVLEYLTKEKQYQPIVIHAFSVGAYMVGEMMLKMESKQKYMDVSSRIAGQVYDSAVDYHQVATGLARSLRTPVFVQKIFEMYVRFHLLLFHRVATCHYIRSSDKYHDTIISAPSLFFFSESDPLGLASIIRGVIKQWEGKGIRVHSRCWEKSPHCGHMNRHQEEYTEELENFLKRSKL